MIHVPRPHPGVFTYSAPWEIPEGALLRIPFGKKYVFGVAAQAQRRSGGNAARFRLKPVESVLMKGSFFGDRLMEYLRWESRATVTPLGDCYTKALPAWVRNTRRAAELAGANTTFPDAAPLSKRQVPHIVTGSPRERLATYREIVLRERKTKHQVLILVPSSDLAESITEHIGGTERAPQGQTKEAQQRWISIRSGTPVCIVGTASALRLPFAALGAIIVDGETSSLYKEQREHPATDAREGASTLAGIHGAKLFSGDVFPRLATWHATSQRKVPGTLKPAPQGAGRYPAQPGDTMVINLTEDKPFSFVGGKPLRGIAAPLAATLEDFATRRANARGIVFINRKGDALSLACRDCGFVFTCPECEAPLPIYKAANANTTNINANATNGDARSELRCRHCGEVFHPPLACPACRGLELHPRGLAAAGLAGTLARMLPGTPVIRLDGDTAKTPRARRAILNAYANTKGPALLIGTEMLLNQSLPRMDLVVVPAFDQLGALPDIQAEEVVFRMIVALRTNLKPSGHFVVQTWHAENQTLADALAGNYAAFAERELDLRRRLDWPPFARVAKLTFRHRDPARAATEAKHLAESFLNILSHIPYPISPRVIGPAPGFIPRIKNQWIWNVILAWTPRGTDDTSVEETLYQNIPPIWDIDVSPASLL